jgi:hypothetical protein
MLRFRRSSLAATLLMVAAVAVAGCTSTPPKTPKPSAAADATPRPTGATHAFPDLEARLPTHVGGQVLDTASIKATPTTQDAKTLEVLRRLGREVSDLQLANADKEGVNIHVGALRIVGADANAAAAAFRAVDEADPRHLAKYTDRLVGQKLIITRTTADSQEFIYPLDDILFVVTGDRLLVEDVLGQL